METNWTLQVETVASYTAEDGTTFQNVIENVHWRVTATNTDGEAETIYGSTAVPKPTDAKNFIDLKKMVALDADTKRTMILGWAEAIEPGFVAEKEAQVVSNLEARLSAPARATISLM